MVVVVVLRMRPQATRKAFGSPQTEGISCIVTRCYGKRKGRIQQERWYQRDRNKEISAPKSLSRILGEMRQELDVLTAAVNAPRASEGEEKKRCNDEIRNGTAATFIRSCWRQLLARKEFQRIQTEAKELSIQLGGDSRTNHLEDRGNDRIQARSDSDFDVKCVTVHFYGSSHNSQSYHWTRLKT